ncbi:MAG: formylglycine-generating enzyme family protein [Cyanothece sp. SIO1E1]|nr:formylglycine-generating enzyme family protein [Cyanothece sp. SIO1E1]
MDTDVRAYVLEKRSDTFDAIRMREVANLLISYIRYLADHSSQLSAEELQTQQWAAMVYLSKAERQTVVTEIVERFQASGVGGAQLGAELLSRAEMARLAQVTQRLKTQLTEYPELIEYASLVSDIQMRNILLEQERVEKTYVVAPAQFLHLPAALRTELAIKNRIRRKEESGQTTGQTVNFIDAQLIDSSEIPFPPPLQPEEFTIITFQVQPNTEPTRNLEPFEFTVATLVHNETQWQIQRQQQRAYQFVENFAEDLILEMVHIPGGIFMMGSELFSRESPPHRVTVPDFCMGKYPVTQAQWQFVVALPRVNLKLALKPSSFEGDNRPVEQISWYEALEFCERISNYTGRQYCLPTESMWEYACRAGTSTNFFFGEVITTDLANYNGDFKFRNGPLGVRRQKTTQVNHFYANSFGLFDMHGNVWELCADDWHRTYEGTPTDGRAWISQDNEGLKVLRGGSWRRNPGNCLSSYRVKHRAVDHSNDIGFRIVMSL